MGSTPLTVRRGFAYPAGATRAWTSTSSGRDPSSVAATADPGAATGSSPRNARAGSVTSRSRRPHGKHPDLLRRPVPVLRRPQQPQRPAPIAVQGQNGVHQVLQGTRPGQRAVLRHVSHQQDRDPVGLRQLLEPRGSLADLADGPRRPGQLLRGHRLDGVHDEEVRTHLAGLLDDPLHVRLGQHADRLGHRSFGQAEPSGRRRSCPTDFLAARVQHRGARGPPGTQEPAAGTHRHPAAATAITSVDLPTPGSPPRRTRLPGTRPPPSTRSTSPIPAPIRAASASAPPLRARGATGALRRGRLASRRRRRDRGSSRTIVSTRLFHAPHARHCPSQRRTTPRTPGRRTGWRRGARPGLEASTGVFSSALSPRASIERPASSPRSMTIVWPAPNRPRRSASASGSSIRFWITGAAAGRRSRVVARRDEEVLGLLGDLEVDLLLRELLAHARQHQVRRSGGSPRVERVEDHDAVDAVQELGPEASSARPAPCPSCARTLVATAAPSVRAPGGSPRLVSCWSELRRPTLQVMMMTVLRKSTRAALGVGQLAVLHDLQEDVEDIRVGLLDLVEQDHASRACAAPPRSAGRPPRSRRSREARRPAAHVVLLHVLGHVDADERVLVAEQELGQRPGQLGLADARGAQEDEGADGPLGVLEPGAGAADGPAMVVMASSWPMTRLCSASSM